MNQVAFTVPAGLPHQTEFWEDTTPNRELAIVGPLGTGKTMSLAVKVALLALENQPQPGALVVPDFPTFDKIHRREWPLIWHDLGLEARIVGAQNPVIKWPWRSETLVYSGNKPETIVGTNLAYAVGDEPALWVKDAYTRITARLRNPKAGQRQLALAGSPEGLPSWFAEYFDIWSVVDGHRGWTRRTIRATKWHPDLADYPDRLRETYASDPAKFDTYARGKFVPLYSGRCYGPFDRQQHVAELEYCRHLPLYLTADFNVAAMRWLVIQVSPHQVSVIDEIALGSEGSVSQAAEEFVTRYGYHAGSITVCGDAAGKARTAQTGTTCYDEMLPRLRERWPLLVVRVPAANPPVRNRVDTVCHLLRGAAGRNVLIDPRCNELILDLEQNVWRPGTTDIDKRDIQRTHAGDAFGYFAHETMPIIRPTKVARPSKQEAMTYSDAMMGAQF